MQCSHLDPSSQWPVQDAISTSLMEVQSFTCRRMKFFSRTVASFTWEITEAVKPQLSWTIYASIYVEPNMLFFIYLLNIISIICIIFVIFHFKETISYRSGSIHLCKITLFPVRIQKTERKPLLRIFVWCLNCAINSHNYRFYVFFLWQKQDSIQNNYHSHLNKFTFPNISYIYLI